MRGRSRRLWTAWMRPRRTQIAGVAVKSKDQIDGWRFNTESGWLLFRMSGTEPLLRIYTEVRDEGLVEPFIAAGRKLAGIDK